MLADDLPLFDALVPDGGYRWWYIDAISDDRRHALVVIAFVGSVFSPYYFRARRRSPAPAERYSAINVALYTERDKYWAMTERGAGQVRRSAEAIRLGASHIEVAAERLEILVDERTMPGLRPLRGRIGIDAPVSGNRSFALDHAGCHRWQPVAPVARCKVAFERPGEHWEGSAYLDANWGSRPLDDDFDAWHWSRLHDGTSATISYQARETGGELRTLALQWQPDGSLVDAAVPDVVQLGGTAWRMDRPGLLPETARLVRTLEDTPFYSRSQVAAPGLCGIHESLSLRRFRAPWVRMLLPFRMPRLARN